MFNVITHITSLNRRTCFLYILENLQLFFDDNMDEESE